LTDGEPRQRIVDGAAVDTMQVREELVLAVDASQILAWRRMKAAEIARVTAVAAAEVAGGPFEHDHAGPRAPRGDRRAQSGIAAADHGDVVLRFLSHRSLVRLKPDITYVVMPSSRTASSVRL
jgi:hypothetical protein